jgi:hypothetical protein
MHEVSVGSIWAGGVITAISSIRYVVCEESRATTRTQTTRVGEEDTTLLVSGDDGGSDGGHDCVVLCVRVCFGMWYNGELRIINESSVRSVESVYMDRVVRGREGRDDGETFLNIFLIKTESWKQQVQWNGRQQQQL